MIENKNKKKTKIETARYITVLDYELGEVFQYKISDQRLTAWNPDEESCEEFLAGKGHRLKDCSWMVHDSSEIITN